MNNPILIKLRQYAKTLPLRIVLAALVFALAYGYSLYKEEPQEGPAVGTGQGLSFDDLYPEQAKQVQDLRIEQSKQPPK